MSYVIHFVNPVQAPRQEFICSHALLQRYEDRYDKESYKKLKRF